MNVSTSIASDPDGPGIAVPAARDLAGICVMLVLALTGPYVHGAGPDGYKPVTDAMLRQPGPDDWLMFSRTYDAQRYSPLRQINTGNVSRLGLAWSRGLPAGVTETIPLVYAGVMYVVVPGARVQALDAANGDLIWEYVRPLEIKGAGEQARTKNLAIYADLVFYTAPDSVVVALDVHDGSVRWEARTDKRGHTSGPLVVEGQVI